MERINPSKREPLIFVNVYPHDWGILLPCSSGVIWEQQTEGVKCNHVQIEGIYIPLYEPDTLLEELQDLNYAGQDASHVWQTIKTLMAQEYGLEWEEIENPNPSKYPDNQEGLQWIRIIRWDSPLGIGKGLEGKEVILIYPNSD